MIKKRRKPKPQMAKRLAEAFRLDIDLGQTLEVEPNPELAELDDEEVALRAKKLARFIPAAASLPEPDEEEPISADTGVFKDPMRRRRRRG